MNRMHPWSAALVVAVVAGGAQGFPGPCTQPAANCQLPDQEVHGGSHALGAASDDNPEAGFRASDNFVTNAGGTITTVCWWGFYLDFDTPDDCGPGTVPDAFTVTYFNNVEAIPPAPGSVRAGPFNVTGTLAKAPTGLIVPTAFGNATEYGFSATHPGVSVTAGECLWVEIRNNTSGSNPPCLWLWSTAPSVAEGGKGDGLSWQSSFQNDFDLSFCINLATGDPGQCALQINPGCNGATNPCTQTSALPGCSDPQCCTLVCQNLPLCCAAAWSAQCVSAAGPVCSQCGQTGTGNCFVSDFTPFCDDDCGTNTCIGCCQTVCAVDPFCCNQGWDGVCVFEAQQLCPCTPSQVPANDLCSGAIAIGLGNVALSNTCGTAGPPSHASCNDGNLVGLGVDVWFKHTAGFTGQLLVSTCNQVTYDTQLAVYDGCNCGSLSDPPLACNNDGAICADGTSLVVVPVISGHCYLIRVGSTFHDPTGTGTLTLSSSIPQPCDIGAGPPGVVQEGEVCGQSINGGCSMPVPAFTNIAFGQTMHGTAWASQGLRDTDWYRLVLAGQTQVKLTVKAEFNFVFGFAQTIPGGSGNCADHTGNVIPSDTGEVCTQKSITVTLGPGTWWPFVAPVAFDGLPCGAGGVAGNDYFLTVGPPNTCPWDCGNNDGQVLTVDFLALLQAWGLAGGPCDFGSGAPGVDASEFLALLQHWGPCP